MEVIWEEDGAVLHCLGQALYPVIPISSKKEKTPKMWKLEVIFLC